MGVARLVWRPPALRVVLASNSRNFCSIKVTDAGQRLGLLRRTIPRLTWYTSQLAVTVILAGCPPQGSPRFLGNPIIDFQSEDRSLSVLRLQRVSAGIALRCPCFRLATIALQ
jgi:hypothetical protein